MSTLFRNPEIKRTFLAHIVITIVFGFIGFLYSKTMGFMILGCCLLFVVVYFLFTYRRYQNLQKLACEIDQILHTGKAISFSEYTEGELSILQNELSKMTLRLVEQAQTLEQDKTYLSDAMADISHQLRSPLTSSQLILSLLKDSSLDPSKRSELLLELSQLLSHMGWLIESMLKMAKMDAKTAYLKTEPVNVSKLITNASEPLAVPMELRQISLEIKQGDKSVSFLGDSAWTTEALLNILKNCMEHTPSGGTISISYEATALYTQICIEDNGSGFYPEDIPHLFERFYKGKDAHSQSVGIGLALSRMIISTQNGTLKAENRSEGGARFLIRFYSSTPI